MTQPSQDRPIIRHVVIVVAAVAVVIAAALGVVLARDEPPRYGIDGPADRATTSG